MYVLSFVCIHLIFYSIFKGRCVVVKVDREKMSLVIDEELEVTSHLLISFNVYFAYIVFFPDSGLFSG